jgi:hypothetical protein
LLLFTVAIHALSYKNLGLNNLGLHLNHLVQLCHFHGIWIGLTLISWFWMHFPKRSAVAIPFVTESQEAVLCQARAALHCKVSAPKVLNACVAIRKQGHRTCTLQP